MKNINKLKVLGIILLIGLSVSCIINSLLISSIYKKITTPTISSTIRDYSYNTGVFQGILTLEEAAEYLKISQKSFEKLLDNNPKELRYIRIGDEYIFTMKNLDMWLDDRILIIKN